MTAAAKVAAVLRVVAQMPPADQVVALRALADALASGSPVAVHWETRR